jgi:beta-lactamase class D
MNKTILLLSLGIFLNNQVFADGNCFLMVEDNKILKQEGDCKSRHAPCSTFKVAIALMGYNEGILIDEDHPELPFNPGYVDWRKVWKQPHTPRSWIKNSTLWFSRVITQKLGMAKFKEYLAKFDYGNQDVSGDKGKNNGLTNAWLSSSLEISPEEQVAFLQKLLDNKLPVGLKAQEITKNILFVEDLEDGWKLYGKTAGGVKLNHDRTRKLAFKIAWFIGWIQKGKRTIIFVQYIENKDKQGACTILRAKATAKEKLIQLIKAEQK